MQLLSLGVQPLIISKHAAASSSSPREWHTRFGNLMQYRMRAYNRRHRRRKPMRVNGRSTYVIIIIITACGSNQSEGVDQARRSHLTKTKAHLVCPEMTPATAAWVDGAHSNAMAQGRMGGSSQADATDLPNSHCRKSWMAATATAAAQNAGGYMHTGTPRGAKAAAVVHMYEQKCVHMEIKRR